MENDFRSRLKQTINDRGITASQLSRLSGVGKSDISNYLNGKYEPKQEKVYLLAKALDVDPGWLITGVQPKPTSEKAIIIPDTDMFRKIIVNMAKLFPHDYEMVMEAFERTEIEMRARGEL